LAHLIRSRSRNCPIAWLRPPLPLVPFVEASNQGPRDANPFQAVLCIALLKSFAQSRKPWGEKSTTNHAVSNRIIGTLLMLQRHDLLTKELQAVQRKFILWDHIPLKQISLEAFNLRGVPV
jgi:hypothetical protein